MTTSDSQGGRPLGEDPPTVRDKASVVWSRSWRNSPEPLRRYQRSHNAQAPPSGFALRTTEQLSFVGAQRRYAGADFRITGNPTSCAAVSNGAGSQTLVTECDGFLAVVFERVLACRRIAVSSDRLFHL